MFPPRLGNSIYDRDGQVLPVATMERPLSPRFPPIGSLFKSTAVHFIRVALSIGQSFRFSENTSWVVGRVCFRHGSDPIESPRILGPKVFGVVGCTSVQIGVAYYSSCWAQTPMSTVQWVST